MDIKAKSPIEFELQGADKLKKLQVGKKAPSEQERTLEAATQFEGLLAEQMTKSMWATVPKGELTGSFEEGFYRDMMSEAMAAELSKGQGLGIKQFVAKEMGYKNQMPKSK